MIIRGDVSDADASANAAKTFLQFFKSRGFDVSAINSWKSEQQGLTPLHAAAEAGAQELVEALVEIAGADVNAKCKLGKTPIYYASSNGHRQVASILIKNGATLHEGLYALHKAAWNGHSDVVKLLIQAGASVSEHDSRGRTPARMSCLLNSSSNSSAAAVAAAAAIEGAGGNNNDGTKSKASPNGADKARALAHILANGGDIRELRSGFPLLHQAAANDLSDCVRVLVANGLDPNTMSSQPSGFKDTALHQACFAGSINAVQELFRLGANLNQPNSIGRTPIASAVMKGHFGCMSVMVNLGASLAAKDSLGFTPLHVAAACGLIKCAYLLVESGADVNASSNVGYSPLMACLKPSICAPSIDQQYYGSRRQRAKVAKFLMEVGADIDAEVVKYAAEGEMNDTIAENMKQLRRVSRASTSSLLTMSVERSEEVVFVRLVERESGAEDNRLYKLNRQLVHHLERGHGVVAAEEEGDGGSREADEGGAVGAFGNLPSTSTSTSASTSSVIFKLLNPADFGFKEGTVSSDGKDVTLEYDGTDFTKEGFAAVVEYLTTGCVHTALVGTKISGKKGDGEQRCRLFDDEAAGKALQAARYFCLEGMGEEVERLMDIYGFAYDDDEDEKDGPAAS